MTSRGNLRCSFALAFGLLASASAQSIDCQHYLAEAYPWLNAGFHKPKAEIGALSTVILPPRGFVLDRVPEFSFGRWLQCLPVETKWRKVLYLSKLTKKFSDFSDEQDQHYRVIAMDLLSTAQDCGGFTVRSIAEYGHWLRNISNQNQLSISFQPLSGTVLDLVSFFNGTTYTSSETGPVEASPSKKARPNNYSTLRSFIGTAMIYTNTESFAETTLTAINDKMDLRTGDILVIPTRYEKTRKGTQTRYGHALIIGAIARNPEDPQQMLIAVLQGNLIKIKGRHYVREPNVMNRKVSPWIAVSSDGQVRAQGRVYDLTKHHYRFEFDPAIVDLVVELNKPRFSEVLTPLPTELYWPQHQSHSAVIDKLLTLPEPTKKRASLKQLVQALLYR